MSVSSVSHKHTKPSDEKDRNFILKEKMPVYLLKCQATAIIFQFPNSIWQMQLQEMDNGSTNYCNYKLYAC